MVPVGGGMSGMQGHGNMGSPSMGGPMGGPIGGSMGSGMPGIPGGMPGIPSSAGQGMPLIDPQHALQHSCGSLLLE